MDTFHAPDDVGDATFSVAFMLKLCLAAFMIWPVTVVILAVLATMPALSDVAVLTTVVQLETPVLGVLFIACAVMWCVWLYDAHKRALMVSGFERLTHTHRMAIWWWFIPIFNWFRPYEVHREIWRVSGEDGPELDEPSPMLLKVWWGLWLMLGVSSRLEMIWIWGVCLLGVTATAIMVIGALEHRLSVRQKTLSAVQNPTPVEPEQQDGAVVTRDVTYVDVDDNTLRIGDVER